MTTPTVFVIDDQQAVRHALGEMLQVFGYSVETFNSADSFLLALTEPKTGCIVADVRMPGMDGIELVRRTLSAAIYTLPVVLYLRPCRCAHGGRRHQVRARRIHREAGRRRPVVAAINRCLAPSMSLRSERSTFPEIARTVTRQKPA